MTTNGAHVLSLAVLTILGHLLVGGNALRSDLEPDQAGWKDGLDPSSRIHGGTFAEFYQFKFLLRIIVKENYTDAYDPNPNTYIDQKSGTGVLLSIRWVLTSARLLPCHFLYNTVHDIKRFVKDPNYDAVFICNDHRQAEEGTLFPAQELYMPHNSVTYVSNCAAPNFTMVTDLGIALLRVDISNLPTDRYEYVTLMSGQMPDILTEGCMAMGYGVENIDEATGEEHWEVQSVYYVNVTVGTQIFCCWVNDTSASYEDRICTYNLKNAAAMPCRGDEGGPLVCPTSDGGLVTVALFIGDQGRLEPSVRCGVKRTSWMNYTSTEAVRDWIRRTTRDSAVLFRTL